MWVRIGASLVLALVGVVLLALPVLAGGFAITTFDQLPSSMHAHEAYQLGYTIRQHGITPVPGLATRIVAQLPSSAETAAFPGRPEGEPGHYVAEVRFPSAGAWQWQVEQGPFAPQQLGSVSVLAAAGAAPAVPRATSTVVELAVARVLLPLASAVAAAVFAWRLMILVRSKPVALVPRVDDGPSVVG